MFLILRRYRESGIGLGKLGKVDADNVGYIGYYEEYFLNETHLF